MDANSKPYGQQTKRINRYSSFREYTSTNSSREYRRGRATSVPISSPEVVAAEGAKDAESVNAPTSQAQQDTQDDIAMSGVMNEESTPLVFSAQDVPTEQYYAKEMPDKININRSENYERYYGSVDIDNHALEFPQPPNAFLIGKDECLSAEPSKQQALSGPSRR